MYVSRIKMVIIIFLLALLISNIGSIYAQDFNDDFNILKMRTSQFWRGVNNFIYADSLLYTLYKSGLAVLKPQEGFLSLDTIALLPLTQSYSNGIRLLNELMLYDESGKIGFVFVKSVEEPEIVAEVDLGDEFLDIEYNKLNVYLTCGFEGVKVYDFSIRSNPVLIKTLEEPSHAVATCIYEKYLYVIDDYNGIFIYSLHDDAGDPVYVGKKLFYHPLKDILATGDNLYCAYQDSGTAVLELSDPENPELIDVLKTDTYIKNVYMVGEYVFSRDAFGNYEIYHPDSIRQSGYFEKHGLESVPLLIEDNSGKYILAVDTAGIGSIYRITYNWRTRLIATIGEGAVFQQIEMKDSTLYGGISLEPLRWLKLNSSYQLTDIDEFPARVKALCRYDDYLFLADNVNGLIWVVQIDTPTSLNTFSFLPMMEESFELEIGEASEDEINLAAFNRDNIVLYNLNKEDFTINSIAYVPGFFGVYGGAIENDYLYVSNGKSRAHIYDISIPSDPVMIRDFKWLGEVFSFVIEDDYLYAAGSAGLIVYEMNAGLPGNISKIYSERGRINHIIKRGSQIFCAADDRGVFVLDESFEEPFRLTGLYETPGNAVYMALEDSALVVNDRYGMITLEINSDGLHQDDSPKFIPKKFSLGYNYPNPFNQTTVIPVDITETSRRANLELSIYNILGQKVRTLYNGPIESGRYFFEWDGTDQNGIEVASGIYLYRFRMGGIYLSRKMVLMK